MTGDRIDLLVVSHSCLTAINRRPYRLLAERGLRVEILVPHGLELGGGVFKEPDPQRPGDPPQHVLPLVGRHPRLWSYRGLIGLLGARRPRIVLIDGDPGGRLSGEIGAWARLHGGRVACISCDNMERTLLGELRHSPRRAAKYLAAEAIGRASALVVDHVFAISPDVKRVMEARGFGGRCDIMPLGFDPALFAPDAAVRARERQRMGLTQPTIGYFGRISREKGVHHLVEALGRIADRPWQLLLDEPPPASAYAHGILARLRELGLERRTVVFTATHDEVGAVMNAADIVVAPSASLPGWKEQYGRVVPEAMACGRAVIATPCGALSWLLGDAGLLAPEADPAGLARTIVKLLDDPALRAELGRRAVARAPALSLPVQVDVMAAVFARW